MGLLNYLGLVRDRRIPAYCLTSPYDETEVKPIGMVAAPSTKYEHYVWTHYTPHDGQLISALYYDQTALLLWDKDQIAAICYRTEDLARENPTLCDFTVEELAGPMDHFSQVGPKVKTPEPCFVAPLPWTEAARVRSMTTARW